MFVALISVPHVDYVRPEYWVLPWAGLEKYNGESWVIRSGPGWDLADGAHDIVNRTYWGRQEA